MIILNEEQAEQVRGVVNNAGLSPVLLTSGEYALGEQVLLDPAHAHHHALLASLPKREVAANEYEGWDDVDN